MVLPIKKSLKGKPMKEKPRVFPFKTLSYGKFLS
jgi:hypothetical protein